MRYTTNPSMAATRSKMQPQPHFALKLRRFIRISVHRTK